MAAGSSSTEELHRDQIEVHHGKRLDSPAYWDIDDDDDDDDDDCGPRPQELYGTFTWTIKNFSQIYNKELHSNSFDLGGYKWCLLIFPQGLENAISAYLSLFLCVVNPDELLPGWSRFAQFTLCVVNKDTTKSKYSDTLHRFWKKEHDWGWKKFIELSRVLDGFLVDDVLTIRAQVQVIRERIDRPFRCLDELYRKELCKVYLTNVESTVRRFIEERRRKIIKLINDERTIWSSLRAFWLGADPSSRQHLTRENTATILRPLVKHIFVEKEVTSTLLMDSLYAGLKVMKQVCKNREETAAGVQWAGEDDSRSTPMVIIDKDSDMFVLTDDAILLLERFALFDSGPHQEIGGGKSSENCSKEVYSLAQARVSLVLDGTLNQTCKRLVAFSLGGRTGNQELRNHTPGENDDARLIKLGWVALECFFIAHVFSRIEAAHQEAKALKLQEELIADEERKKE